MTGAILAEPGKGRQATGGSGGVSVGSGSMSAPAYGTTANRR
jgi:hypothetical protein